MIKTKEQLAINLIKIYKIKIYLLTEETITHYWLHDYGDKPFIFTKTEIHDLIHQSSCYHGFKVPNYQVFCISVRKIIDEILIKSNLVLIDHAIS